MNLKTTDYVMILFVFLLICLASAIDYAQRIDGEGNASISTSDRYYMKKFEENVRIEGMLMKKGRT